MRFTKSYVLALALLSGTGYLAGCASSTPNRSAGQAFDDTAITTKVKAALAKDTGLGNAMDIHVNTYQGTVQLSGFIGSRDLANRAAQIARGVEGVRNVKNDLEIVAGRNTNPSTGSSTAPANR